MKKISVSDITIKKCFETAGAAITFKEKQDIASILDELGLDVIELPKIEGTQADSLLIKSLAGSLKGASLAVNADIYPESIDRTWEALGGAEHPRLQIVAPVSPARMEYVYHKKPAEMLETVREAVAHAAALCDEVEFIANDATRADTDFLYSIINAAIEAGAKRVSVSDSAGFMLPEEVENYIAKLFDGVPGLGKDIKLGFGCADSLHMADACGLAAIRAGADEIKTCAWPVGRISLESVAQILYAKGDELGYSCQVRTTSLRDALSKINNIFTAEKRAGSPFDDGVRGEAASFSLSAEADFDEIMGAAFELGYTLGDEDKLRVWKAYKKVAGKKTVGSKELEALIAAEAMQVPETYVLESYAVTTGNKTDVFAHIKLSKGDEILDGISLGDGPIDAAFLAVEKIIGRHFELDDFQIQSITEGREAMGQTLVKLRAHGKLYSGVGTSTDIIGSGIKAYINALNKIVYEEENG